MPDIAWRDFVATVASCRSCSGCGVVNILDERTGDGPWGLPWYDNYRNLDGGLMIVGMDFGNEDTVRQQRAHRARNPQWEPEQSQDKSYVRLSGFLKAAGLAKDAFVTNAALCVRSHASNETGVLPKVIYANCSQHLRAQINLAKPYVIAALGGDALEFTCDALRVPRPSQSITKIAGSRIPMRVNGATVTLMPFIHPSRPQDAHGWPDARQASECYGEVRMLLAEARNEMIRDEFRARFGLLA